jgi:cell division protein FtsZ
MDQLLTVEDVARIFQITPAQVEQLVRERKLAAYRILDSFRFSPEALQTFLDTHAAYTVARAMGGRARNRYQALSDLLARCRDNAVVLSFEQINAALEAAGAEPLVDSAYKHRAWWANTETHTHASAWLEMGWRVQSVDLERRTVVFSRATHRERTGAMQVPSVNAPTIADSAIIKVIGVGGAGCNVINRMIAAGVRSAELVPVNTDNQVLLYSPAPFKIRIGDMLTKGLSTGGDPALGRRAAEESYEELRDALQGADMIFITAGMGGGTGTGAAPVVARIARELGALTVGVITMPFSIEGTRRRRIADEGAAALREQVDTLITVPNDRLLAFADQKMTITMAFALADDVLRQGIQGISDTITVPGLINLDFAAVKSMLSEAGAALIGIGRASGDRRAVDAARQAIASPLLDVSMEGAHSVLFNVRGGDYTLMEVNDAAQIIQEAVDPDANIIFGAVLDDDMKDEIQITVIATRFDGSSGPPPSQGGRDPDSPGGGPDLQPQPSPLLPPNVNPPLSAAEPLPVDER